jgi:alpha-1,3-glucan synthase
MSDDNSSIDHTESQKGIIEPPPKGSKMSRKLSLGTHLGPGHIRQKHESGGTIESLGAIDEEQRVHMLDDEDEGYIYTAETIRRQFASTQTPDDTDANDSSDQDEDVIPTGHGKPRRVTDSVYVDDDNYLADRTQQNGDVPPVPALGLSPMYAGALNPSTNPTYATMNTSQLSLASVLSGRDQFALAKVDDFFTDSDGKYFKRFQVALSKLDPKTSKAQLCIDEFLIKSE